MITGKGIEETEESEARGGVDKGVYAGQRVAVLRGCFIEVGEVHAHSPLLIGFWHHDHIG